jgi:hypothetical protein
MHPGLSTSGRGAARAATLAALHALAAELAPALARSRLVHDMATLLLPLYAQPGSWARSAGASDPARAPVRAALRAGAAPGAARGRKYRTAGGGGPGATPDYRTAMLRVRGGAGGIASCTEAAGNAAAARASLAAADTGPITSDSATAGGAVSAAAPTARGRGKAREPRTAHRLPGRGACFAL